MPRTDLNDLAAFLAVAQERSFTRAAAQLGVSQSALSQTLRGLEARLGLRLLTRTTRSVATTEAGERLLRAVGPAFEQIEAGLSALNELREKPAGMIRITAGEHAAETILWPKLAKFLPGYPEIQVEISTDGVLTNIVAERYDAGVRFGEQVERDMIFVPIGPEVRFAVVGAPSCFARRAPPTTRKTSPRTTASTCVCLPAASSTPWEFEKGGRELRVRVEGQLVFSSAIHALDAALGGFGLAYVPEDLARPHLAAGRLVWVLEDWSPPFPGYHLYYPSRRQASPAFALLVEALRHRG